MAAVNYRILIQARSSSARLNRKVLLEVQGKPLIQHQLDRITKAFPKERLLVATSSEASDDELASYVISQGCQLYRGSLTKVATRFLEALKLQTCDAFFRVCADSPCYDPEIMLQALKFYEAGDFDLVTNCFPRSYPKGFSTELIRTQTFLENFSELSQVDDNEIFTQFFYRNAKRFRIHNFQCPGGDFSNISQCVDTPEDFERFKKIVAALGDDFVNVGWNRFTT